MATDMEDSPIQTAASLLGGILGDLQRLVEQQFQLTRREIEEELHQRAAAGLVFAMGAGTLFLAVMFTCLAISHGLHVMSSPAGHDPARIPLWACHAIIATGLSVIGGILVAAGCAKYRAIEVYRNPATEILQERVPWTNQAK